MLQRTLRAMETMASVTYFQKLLLTRLIYFLVVFCVTQGAVVEFNATPTEVKEGLTSNLTLRCRLVDSATSGGVVGRRGVSQTAVGVAEVMSLVVMKAGKDVAAVSHSDPARVMDGSVNVAVAGSVAGSGGRRGFLQVQIDDPSPAQTGEFVCEVNVISHAGHVMTLTSSLEVSTTTPTMADLVGYVRQINREKEDMKKNMEKETQDMKQAIADLQKEVHTTVLFSAALTHSLNIPPGQVLVFDKTLVNVGGAYSNTTGSFVCPEPGYYQFTMSALSDHDKIFDLGLYHNSRDVVHFHGTPGHANQGNSQTTILRLAKGDVLQVRSYYTTSSLYGTPTDVHSTFTGLRVARG